MTASAGKPARAARSGTGPRSLGRLLGLFDVLAQSKHGLSLAKLNVELDSPKSSLLNLLRPLVAEEYLIYEDGRYRLGAVAFRMAASIMSVWSFPVAIRPYLEELSLSSHESVYLGVLDRAGKAIVYADVIESPQSVRFTVPLGAARPLYCTAAGRVLLAFSEPNWQENYLRTTRLDAHTPRTTTSRKALRDELERIRCTKVSVSLGEMFPESAAVAAPVFGADGRIMAAIAIGAPVSRMEGRLAEFRPLIAAIANRASGMAKRSTPSSAAAAATVEPAAATKSRRRVSLRD